MAVPRGKVKPFCAACGAVDQMRYIESLGAKAIQCVPCLKLYPGHDAVWETMKDHPNFIAHVGKDAGKLAAAEAKRERKSNQWWRNPGEKAPPTLPKDDDED